MADAEETGGPEELWVARLTPEAGRTVAELLAMPLGLDVWERAARSLVVAAPESRLGELERRRLARVDRVAPVARYLAEHPDHPPAGSGG